MDARMRFATLPVLAVLAVAVLAAACGGGGSEGGSVGASDPAEVPTSTPIGNPLTFRTKNDELQINPAGGTGTPGTGASDPQTHVIGEGETCADIASQYGITVDDLKRANSDINSDCTNLIAGEELRIPSASPTAGPT